jgi:pyruvate/2-oxoglutarate dehydrogenase complex dihydrolipoamide acyltransferase (E2) component
MSEQLPDRPDGHPIVSGLIALAGVTVAVGLVLGLLVVAGSSVLGLGGESDTGTSTSERSMYLPKPQKTPTETAPEVTLAPGASGSAEPERTASSEPTESASPRKQITLSASTTSASAMEQFDLTGVYPSGEGAILQVQRFEGGAWADFNATGSVSGGTFQIPIYTSQAGVNRFRVVDSDSGLESNEIRITIG